MDSFFHLVKVYAIFIMHFNMKVGLHAALIFKNAMEILKAPIIEGVKMYICVMKVVDTLHLCHEGCRYTALVS